MLAEVPTESANSSYLPLIIGIPAILLSLIFAAIMFKFFKTWLRDISHKVAEAAVDGSFLGFGGVRVSEAERATLRDISKALGIAS